MSKSKMVLGLLLVPWSVAQAAAIQPTLNTQLCLDVAGGSNVSGTVVQIAHCSGDSAQNWSGVNGTVQALGKCLDVRSDNSANGTAVQLWDCNGSDAQQWNLQGGGLVWAGAGNKCLDINAGRANDGQPMQIWDCQSDDAAQQWTTALTVSGGQTAATATYQPTSAPGLCMDVAGGTATNGAAVQLAHCSGNAAQAWSLTDGTMQALGMCLDNPNSDISPGTLLHVYGCKNNASTQKWRWTGTALQLMGTNLCVDVPKGRQADGQQLQLWGCAANDQNQQWSQTDTQVSAPSVPVTASPSSPSVATGRILELFNNCNETVWVALQNNGGQPIPSPSGFALNSNSQRSVSLPALWGGRLWGRTGCTEQGNTAACDTGDCGGVLACNGAGGQPSSLLEFLFDGWNGPSATQDYYDISLVDAFNLPVAIAPIGGSGVCKAPKCTVNILDMCPADLQQTNAAGAVVACLSSCTKYQTDDTCCRNAHNTPATCPAPEGARIFKQACPDAYSYAYDDGTSTWNCTAPSGYAITFCP